MALLLLMLTLVALDLLALRLGAETRYALTVRRPSPTTPTSASMIVSSPT